MIGGNLGAAVQMLKVMNQQGGAAGYVPFTADTTLYSSDSTLETADMTYIESSIEGMMSGTWYEVDVQRGEHLIREKAISPNR